MQPTCDIKCHGIGNRFAYMMSMADPDTMTLKEALKQPNAEDTNSHKQIMQIRTAPILLQLRPETKSPTQNKRLTILV